MLSKNKSRERFYRILEGPWFWSRNKLCLAHGNVILNTNDNSTGKYGTDKHPDILIIAKDKKQVPKIMQFIVGESISKSTVNC